MITKSTIIEVKYNTYPSDNSCSTLHHKVGRFQVTTFVLYSTLFIHLFLLDKEEEEVEEEVIFKIDLLEGNRRGREEM